MGVEGQTSAEGQPTKESNVSVEELMRELQAEKASKIRILEESKTYKTKFQEASSTLDKIERERLEKEGKTEEILLKEREEKKKLMENLTGLRDKTVKANIKGTLFKYANDAHSIDDLLTLPSASSIEYDEETLEPIAETVESFVNSVRETKPYFFGSKKVAPMGEGKPKGDSPPPAKPTLEDALTTLLKK